jgi:hypothetical protein
MCSVHIFYPNWDVVLTDIIIDDIFSLKHDQSSPTVKCCGSAHEHEASVSLVNEVAATIKRPISAAWMSRSGNEWLSSRAASQAPQVLTNSASSLCDISTAVSAINQRIGRDVERYRYRQSRGHICRQSVRLSDRSVVIDAITDHKMTNLGSSAYAEAKASRVGGSPSDVSAAPSTC